MTGRPFAISAASHAADLSISGATGRVCQPRSATVTAASACDLLELDRPALDRIAAAHPDVRRVLRAIQQEYKAALSRQQAEIDAILDVLMEKHVTSVGELRRHVMKHAQQQQQSGGGRAARLHEALWGGGTTPAATPSAAIVSAVAPIMMTTSPAGASGVSQGLMRSSPGSSRPSAPSTSTTPMKRTNHPGSGI